MGNICLQWDGLAFLAAGSYLGLGPLTATVEEQWVLIAAGRHLAASVVEEQKKREFGLILHLGGCLSKAVG